MAEWMESRPWMDWRTQALRRLLANPSAILQSESFSIPCPCVAFVLSQVRDF